MSEGRPTAFPLMPPPGRDPRAAPLAAVAALAPPVPAVPVPAVLPAKRAPKPRRDLTLVQRAVTPAEEIAFATIETELGGRQKMVAVLASADLNADEGKILGLLADPGNDALSLAKVCIGGGLKVGRLLKLFQAAALAKGQTAAISRIAAKLPDVAASVMDDAVGGERVCDACHGFGQVKKPTKDDPGQEVECPECRGRCVVQFHPEAAVREMALRVGGLLEKGGGAKVQILNQNAHMNVQQGSPADSASYDQLMTQLDRALYGAGHARSRTGAEAKAEAEAAPRSREDDPPDVPLEGEMVE